VTDHKFLEDVYEDSLQIPRQKNQFLCNRPDEPLKATGHPVVSRSSDVRTLGQASPISTRSWILAVDTVWEVSARRPDDVATRPDAVPLFKIFRTSVQKRKGVLAKIVRMPGQAVWTYTCYGKICAILEGGRRRPSRRG
jgi:hypothetical protein